RGHQLGQAAKRRQAEPQQSGVRGQHHAEAGREDQELGRGGVAAELEGGEDEQQKGGRQDERGDRGHRRVEAEFGAAFRDGATVGLDLAGNAHASHSLRGNHTLGCEPAAQSYRRTSMYAAPSRSTGAISAVPATTSAWARVIARSSCRWL